MASNEQGGEKSAAFTLIALGVVSFFNYLDRSAFSVLAVPIKEDLGLTDTQIGLVGGLGFSLFYATMGLPLAWVADRGRRITLLSVCLAAWSAATAACGMATSFVQLLLARVGVGAGEAGCVPASYSLLSDLFPQKRRAFAVGMFHFGGNIGFLGGLMLAGLLAQVIGWRETFILLGAPGIVLALVLNFVLREPQRGRLDKPIEADGPRPSFGAVLKRPAYLHALAGNALMLCGFYAILLWLPAFYARTHGLTSAEIGLYHGASFGGGMVLGVAVGAVIASWLIERARQWEMWFPAVTTLLSMPLFVLVLLAPSAPAALIATFVATFVFTMGLGPAFSVAQSLSEAPVRAAASALVLLTSAIFGQGLGPTAVGMLSDAWASQFGEFALRNAMLAPQITLLWGAVHFYLGGRRCAKDAVA